MLAIIGLLGLAVAGTAFVGFPTLSGGSDTDPSGLPQTMQRRKQMTLKQRTLAASRR
jgi:hypothetical protein